VPYTRLITVKGRGVQEPTVDTCLQGSNRYTVLTRVLSEREPRRQGIMLIATLLSWYGGAYSYPGPRGFCALAQQVKTLRAPNRVVFVHGPLL
jgi:hypothetical protein